MSTELTPTDATKKRVSQLTKSLLPEIDSFWKPVLDAGLDPQIWNLLDPRLLPALDPALAFLKSKFDPDFLALAPLETLVFPDLTGVATDGKPADKSAHLFLLTCFHTAANHIGKDSIALLEQVFSRPRINFNDRAPYLISHASGAQALHFPGCSDDDICEIANQLKFPPKTLDSVLPFLRHLASGDYTIHEDHKNAVSRIRSLAVLHAIGEFEYDHYKNLVTTKAASMIPGRYLDPAAMETRRKKRVPKASNEEKPKEKKTTDTLVSHQKEFEKSCNHFAVRLAHEIGQKLDAENFIVLDDFRDYYGADFLIEACEAIERLGLTQNDFTPIPYDSPQEVINRMANITRLDENDDPASVITRLKKFKPETLEAVIYRSGAARELVVKALGWEKDKKYHFNEFLIAQIAHYGNSGSFSEAFENGTDPTSGVLPRAEIVAAAEGLKPAERKSVIKKLQGKGVSNNAKFLFSAIFGDNKTQVEKSLKRFGQPAAKALGLLPLPDKKTDADSETEARYRALLEFEKGCKKFGSERRANSHAATQVGLENLAQNAGYGDSERLAWAMEARIAGGGAGEEPPESQSIEIGDYTVILQIESGRPSLHVEKKEKPLKSIPAAVRKTAEYKKLRETADHLKAQFTRFRNRLEEMMARSETLSADDLATMAKLPALRHLLTSLVLRSKSGAYGTYEPGKKKLVGISNKATKLPAGPFVIAHPHHFHAAGVLSDWQRELVHRRLVQPFKQVFRELYILTPAEEKSETSSARFAGRTLTSNVAARLLQSRGWLDKGDYDILIHKTFRAEGVVSVLELAEYGHYLTETETIDTGNLVFYPFPSDTLGSGDPLPLTDIPPTIFSEVLRDVDLAASVAYVGDGYWTSSQTRVRRRDLLDAIVADFALQGVTTDGNYADVKGTLASYRVHLDTGAIYIGGSNHICVVPDNSKAPPQDIYLPFAAEDDPKLREVIGRILMLLNDDKIRDKTILEQIKNVSQ